MSEQITRRGADSAVSLQLISVRSACQQRRSTGAAADWHPCDQNLNPFGPHSSVKKRKSLAKCYGRRRAGCRLDVQRFAQVRYSCRCFSVEIWYRVAQAGAGRIIPEWDTLELCFRVLIILWVISIHQTSSNINSDNNNSKLNYKHFIKYYNLLQNWQKAFTVEIYRNVNLSRLLLRTQLGRSIAKQL